MPDPAFNPGLLADPQDYLKAQRQQLLGQALTQFAFSPSQPTNPGPMASRVSILSPLARALGGRMAANAMNGAATSQIAMANALRNMQMQALNVGGNATPDASAAPIASAGAASGTNQYARAQMMGQLGIDPEVIKNYLANQSPTEPIKTAVQAGAPLNAVANKQFGIEMRPGAALKLPDGSMIRNPNLSQNLEGDYQDGNLVGVHAAPGAASALQNLEYAEERGKTLGGVVKVPTASGGEMVGLGDEVFGGTKRPSYFPSTSRSTPADDGKLAGMPKLVISNASGSSPGIYDQKFFEHAAAKRAELSEKYGTAADLANQRNTLNMTALKSLSGAETGPASEFLTHMRGYLVESGLASQEQASKLNNTQELNKVLGQKAIRDGKDMFGSRYTQSEVGLMMNQLNPSTKMSHAVIKELTTQAMIKDAYEQTRANDYGEYIQRGGDPMRFESWYPTHHSLQTFANRVRPQIEAQVNAAIGESGAPISKTIDGVEYHQVGGQWLPVKK